MLKKYVVLVIVLVFASNMMAQSAWKNLNTTNSGLPSNKINCIEKDSLGTIWIGTDKGLCKYDGQKWTVFNTKNSKILDDNIQKIVIDKKGRKWIHFANNNLLNFNVFNDTTWNTISLNSQITIAPNSPDYILYDFSKLNSSDLDVINLVSNSNANKRINLSSILLAIDPKTNLNNSIPLNISSGALQNSLNSVKISTGKIRITVKEKLPFKTIFKFTFNNLIKDGKRVTDSLIYDPPSSITYAELHITNCTADLSNKALDIRITDIISIPNSTAKYFSNDKIVLGFELFDTQIKLSTIKDYSIDSSNKLWFLTNDNLYKQNADEFIVFNTFNNYFTATEIRKIRFDLNGNQWFITNKGLFKYDNTTWEVMDANSDINDIVFDKNGINWIYANSGLYRLINKTKTSISPLNPAIQISNIQDLKIDKMGNKWGLTNQALFQFDNTNWTTYSSSNSQLNSNSASKLLIDRDNNKWITTDNGISILYGSGISDLCNNSNQKLIDATYNDDCSILLRSLKNDPKNSYTWSYGKYINSNFVKLPSNNNSIIIKDFGYYVLNIQDSSCFMNSSAIKAVDTILPSLPICMVTTTNNHNLIIWENINNTYVNKYRIYKQSKLNSNYELVHEQSKKVNSTWLDTNSNNQIERYKLSILDACGRETMLSENHTTILLSSNLGSNSTVNLAWNPYEGFSYKNFEIWRSTDGVSFNLLSTVANNTYAYIDNNPPATGYYQIRIVNPTACNPSVRGIHSVISNTVDKNGKIINVLGLEDNLTNSNPFRIFPNPNLGVFIIENVQPNTIFSLFDLTGHKVYEQISTNTSLEVTLGQEVKKGIYFLQATLQGNLVGSEKIVIE